MTDTQITVGLVQMTATDDVAGNGRIAAGLIDDAVAQGAGFVATPEMTNILTASGKTLWANVQTEEQDPTLALMRKKAAALGIWLLVGSLAIRRADDKLANRSFMIDPKGEVRARYDKIHMFDVELPGGESYRESKSYTPGAAPVAVHTPFGLVGMSICYDVRFPYLYRQLGLAGTGIICVPAAFTKTTGEAHWHTLLQARAIETGCFILAPAQVGHHGPGRETFGHSLIIDPWGKIISDGQCAVGVLTATLHLSEVKAAHSKIPSLSHAVELENVVIEGDAQ